MRGRCVTRRRRGVRGRVVMRSRRRVRGGGDESGCCVGNCDEKSKGGIYRSLRIGEVEEGYTPRG